MKLTNKTFPRGVLFEFPVGEGENQRGRRDVITKNLWELSQGVEVK
jgi:hypothetical protein